MKVDRDRLVAELHALEIELRNLKNIIRLTPVPWPENYARKLRELKAEATLLYAIIAHARGRLHLRKVTRSHAHLQLPQLPTMTLEDQARFIGDRWLRFQLEENTRWAG